MKRTSVQSLSKNLVNGEFWNSRKCASSSNKLEGTSSTIKVDTYSSHTQIFYILRILTPWFCNFWVFISFPSFKIGFNRKLLIFFGNLYSLLCWPFTDQIILYFCTFFRYLYKYLINKFQKHLKIKLLNKHQNFLKN